MPARVIPFRAPPAPRLFTATVYEVAVVRPDGTTHTLQRRGGSSIDHAQEAMELGGLGAVVRVRRVDQLQVVTP